MLLWHNGGAPSQHQPPPPPSQDLSAVPGGSEPPGMARGGGCGCQPCRPVQGLISGTGCHSGCSQPWGHPWGCRDPPGHPQACGFAAWCCGDGGEAARCHRSPWAPTRAVPPRRDRDANGARHRRLRVGRGVAVPATVPACPHPLSPSLRAQQHRSPCDTVGMGCDSPW